MSSAPSSDTSAVQPTPGQAAILILDTFLLQLRSIGNCAKEVVEFAHDVQSRKADESWRHIEAKRDQVAKSEGRSELAELTNEAFTAIRQYRILMATVHSDLLLKSLFLSAFSMFEAYLAAMLRQIYRCNERTLRNIEKSIELRNLLECATREDAIAQLVGKDIESLLRLSYGKLFKKLGKRFGLEELTELADLPQLVECYERRNLIAHSDGYINEQYRTKCAAAGFKLDTLQPDIRFSVTLSYLLHALGVLYEVSFRFAHSLLQKVRKHESAIYVSHMLNAVVEALDQEEWHLAENLAKFALDIPGQGDQLDIARKRLNYAQAVRWGGDSEKCRHILNEVDWSNSHPDFQLAFAVLKDDYDLAESLMKVVGRDGKFITERGYLFWPIFREFRKTEQFARAFQAVYGRSFRAAATKELAEQDQTELQNDKSNETIESPGLEQR